MIGIEKWATIRTMFREGYGKKKIARILKVSVNTVRRALATDDPPKYLREKSETKLDPYKDQAKQMYLEFNLIGTRIFNELAEKGYGGSITTLYRYLKTIEKVPAEKVTARFETAPGIQAQFDWSPYDIIIAGKKRRVYCFLIVLGYSRYKYMTFSTDQTLPSVIQSLEEGLRFLGGAPREILIDNAKQMVLETLKDNVKGFNETFLGLAGMYSFKPVACRIRRARTKGKVERPFYYIEQHFIKGREFESIESLIEQGHLFIDHWNGIENKTTLKAPIKLLPLDLIRLATVPLSRFSERIQEQRKVSWDCLVSVKGSRYSVPHQYAGKRVWVRVEHGSFLLIYSMKGELIARHELSDSRGTTNIDQVHYQGLQPVPKSTPRIREVFCEHFPSGEQFYIGLKKRVTCNAAYHAQKILMLREYYSDETIEQAINKALKYKAFSHEAVGNILKQHPFKQMALPKGSPKTKETGCGVRPLSYYSNLLH